MIMRDTTESNAVTTEIIAHEAKKNKNKKVMIQIGLLNAEMRNLQKDMDSIRENLELLLEKLEANERKK